MEDKLIKRIDDLAEMATRKAMVTATHFLTPAEVYDAQDYLSRNKMANGLFWGGAENCERKMLFFLPDYLEPEYFTAEEHISAVKIRAYFGEPGHRDYLGAIMACGVTRESIGDIILQKDTAYVFCRTTVAREISCLESVGRFSVRAEEIEPDQVPAAERQFKHLSFTVMSPRLDAVVSGIFHISRTEAAKFIAAEKVELNYHCCSKNDAAVREGDILSVRGLGKAVIREFGGLSRKGREYMNVDLYT